MFGWSEDVSPPEQLCHPLCQCEECTRLRKVRYNIAISSLLNFKFPKLHSISFIPRPSLKAGEGLETVDLCSSCHIFSSLTDHTVYSVKYIKPALNAAQLSFCYLTPT